MEKHHRNYDLVKPENYSHLLRPQPQFYCQVHFRPVPKCGWIQGVYMRQHLMQHYKIDRTLTQ